jgi:hypothetical protein
VELGKSSFRPETSTISSADLEPGLTPRSRPLRAYRIAAGSALVIAIAAILTFGSGCAGNSWWKSDTDNKVPAGIPTAPLSLMAKSDGNQILQASGSTPAASSSTNSFSWLNGNKDKDKDKGSKQPVADFVVAWRNRIDYLPDPTQGGKGRPGLAGQLFLFGTKMQSVDPEGTLTVELFDETTKASSEGAPEHWELPKEILKAQRAFDERFGRCYALFLPWPTYRPDVSRIRITAHFDTEGRTLYAPETKITLNDSVPTSLNGSWTQQDIPPIGGDRLGLGPASGMGSSVSGSRPDAMNGGVTALGVVGSRPSGLPGTNQPSSLVSGPPIPISGASMNGSGATPGGSQAQTGTIYR